MLLVVDAGNTNVVVAVHDGASWRGIFRIATEPHTNILSIKPDIPPCIAMIIDKALAKKAEDRYPTGAEMAKAIRLCAASLQG